MRIPFLIYLGFGVKCFFFICMMFKPIIYLYYKEVVKFELKGGMK